MDKSELLTLLTEIAEGKTSPEIALDKIETKSFGNIDFAKPDYHRQLRQGVGEVIYGAGKTAEQILKIANDLLSHGQKRILVTRMSEEKYASLKTEIDMQYYPTSGIGIVGKIPKPNTDGTILIVAAGTSDLPVVEEAELTAKFLGNQVQRIVDVGVAGIHRLLAHIDDIKNARVIIAVAGMEGALASVVGGLASSPVIAVPTSVGYGAYFGGISALLSMLNSCASGVSVVNIDNGFGAAYTASLINHM